MKPRVPVIERSMS